MSQIGGNKLKPNKSPKIIFGTLNKAKVESTVVIAWKIIGNRKITAELKFRLIRKFKSEIEFLPIAESAENLKQILGGSESINFFLPSFAVLFQSKLKSYDDNGSLLVAFPEMMAQIDRRKNLRLYLDDKAKVQVNFMKSLMTQRVQTQTFDKSCYDISAGGVSFIISKMEKKFFEQNDMIPNMELFVDGKTITMDGEIVNLIPIEPNEQNNLVYKGYKVCLQFQKPVAEFVKIIELFVFKHIDIEQAS